MILYLVFIFSACFLFYFGYSGRVFLIPFGYFCVWGLFFYFVCVLFPIFRRYFLPFMMIWVYRLHGVRTRAKKNNGIPKDLEISYGGKIVSNVIFKVG